MLNHTYIDENQKEVTLNASVIDKVLLIEDKISALLTTEGKLFMQVHVEGYWNHEMFKLKTMTGAPIQILALEKYYIAANNNEIQNLWREQK